MNIGNNVIVERLLQLPVSKQRVEIVERKGKGHPDTIADGVAEAVSRKLSLYYIEKFDRILHHNVDKVLVVGGCSFPRFGGGEVVEPIYILVSGRATYDVKVGTKYEKVPVGEIALEASREYIRNNFRFLDPDKHVIVDYRIGRGSVDLVSVFEKGASKIPLANDTSIGVGYAPLTDTEKLVLKTEEYLNSEELKKRMPEVGEDVKVMGLRVGEEVTLTVATALISSLIPDSETYMEVKEKIKEEVKRLAKSITDMPVSVHVNTADDPDHDIYYLTITGTSAESGDDGATGRGNRVNGLIPFNRYVSFEAAAGKNPVSHVGKIYNVLAQELAFQIYREVEGFDEVYVKLLSQIGRPINQPLIACVQVIAESEEIYKKGVKDVKCIVEEGLGSITKITEKFLKGEFKVF